MSDVRTVMVGVLAIVAGTFSAWAVWVANWGDVNEGMNTFNLAVAAVLLVLSAIALGAKTRSGERAWRASAQAVQRSPRAIASGLLATAGGFLLGWWLAAVGLYDTGDPIAGMIGLGAIVLLFFVAAIALQWGRSSTERPWLLIGASALLGAALFLLAALAVILNYGGR